MEIKTLYEAPFGPLPALRLSYIKRWGIISMDKQQSVAEHAFNVSLITEYICKKLRYDRVTTDHVMVKALRHDNDEVYSGDIPSPAKTKSTMLYEDGEDVSTFDVIKLADLIESVRYLNAHCNDTAPIHGWIDTDIRMGINIKLKALGLPYEAISELINLDQ